jgi:5-methylcytosine-specific restriction endonuclease McrA
MPRRDPSTGRWVPTHPDAKRCCKCDGPGPFYKDARMRDGLATECRKCKSAVCIRWAKAHPERVRESQARSRKKHRSRLAKQQRAYNLARAPAKRAYVKEWRRKNAERVRAQKRDYEARLRGAAGNGITEADRGELLQMQAHRCFYCGCDLRQLDPKDLTLDHVIPLKWGGAHDPTNVVYACRPCNSGKHDSPVLYIMTDSFMHPDQPEWPGQPPEIAGSPVGTPCARRAV